MTVTVRLKTGFFKTSAYKLTIDQAGLCLVPDDPLDQGVTLLYSGILSVTMRETKQPQIEILTRCETYAGVFHTYTDFLETLHLLKEYSDVQTVCEFG